VSDTLPLVTLGVPVRNGAAMLRAALDSIVAQDYPNIEIIVSDNASDDATPEILAEYAARHPNMRVIRQEKALGAFDNFLFVMRQAKGQFFAWCAHDDTRSKDFVSMLLPAFADPQAVLAFGDLYVWDGVREPLLRSDYDFENEGLPRWRRLRMTAHMQCYHIYGLWRLSALRSIRYHPTYWWPDMPIMLAAAADGIFKHVRGPRFNYFEVVKTDAERAAYQDYRKHISSLHGLAALLVGTGATLVQSGKPLAGFLGVAFILEKYARYLPYYVSGRVSRWMAGRKESHLRCL